MAMHCPQCLTEYRDGFTECADCHVPLAPGSPAKSRDQSHAVELVTVLETTDPFVANLAKATLEDNGVEYVMGGDDPNERGLSGMSPMGAMKATFQVEAQHADEARELLEPLRNPEPLTEEETVSDPPPANSQGA